VAQAAVDIRGVDRAAASSPDWARKYPPLLTVALALLLTLAVLPSALNLPQSNPQETLEYAPVPPDDNSDSPPQGNLSALGLGSSAGIEGSGAAGGAGAGRPPPPPPPLKTDGGPPTDPNVQCSANNQQTFDPLSPPCVPFFDGDNFGTTYGIGVSGDEIKIVFYLDGGINYINGSEPSNRTAPADQTFDLWKTPEDNQVANKQPKTKPEHLMVKGVRVWQDYFNKRFQTYKRKVHFYVAFAVGPSPEERRADAAKQLREIGPFAVVSIAEGNEDAYLNSMARKGVLNFGSFGVRKESFFANIPKMFWSYLPSVEQQVQSYGSYVCRQVVDRYPSLAGPDVQQRSTLENGGKRKIAILSTTDEDFPGLVRMAEMVEDEVTKCGGKIAYHAHFPNCCLAQDPSTGNEANNDIAQMKQQGITTILWTGAVNGNYARSAAGAGYFPEWIVLGDGILDAKWPIRLSQSTGAFDGHAILVSPQPFQPAVQQQNCYQAYREVDKMTPNSDLAYTCGLYTNFFQLFVGIQVAGPRLGPTTMDKGFHRIPQRYDGTPQVPACFYLPGDYTCVKDGAAYIWNANETAPGDQQPGCWKAIEGGKRYAPDGWPRENIEQRINGSEPCTGYDARVRFSPA
jgi:hypothetical protein